MLKVPIEIDPYSNDNIKKVSKREFALELFRKVFDFLDQHYDEPGYEDEVKRMRDLKNSLDYAWEEGYNKGLAIAKKMKENFSINEIVKYTGHSKEEIEKLK